MQDRHTSGGLLWKLQPVLLLLRGPGLDPVQAEEGTHQSPLMPVCVMRRGGAAVTQRTAQCIGPANFDPGVSLGRGVIAACVMDGAGRKMARHGMEGSHPPQRVTSQNLEHTIPRWHTVGTASNG